MVDAAAKLSGMGFVQLKYIDATHEVVSQVRHKLSLISYGTTDGSSWALAAAQVAAGWRC